MSARLLAGRASPYPGAAMLRRGPWIAALASLALGCSNEPQTCDLATSELWMSATISDLNGTVEVEIEFESADRATTLELCPDRDKLTVNGAKLESIRVFGEQYYRVEFDSAESNYEIRLERSGAEDATISFAMPPSFEILAPTANASVSRSEPLTLEWAPSWPGEEIQVAVLDDIGSSCIEGLGVFAMVPDEGSYAIGGSSLAATDIGQECEVALILTRTRVEDHPAGRFAGGAVSGVLSRGFEIVSTP